jgi:hypothetical protein
MDAGTDSDAPTQPIEHWAWSKATEIMEREGEALVLSARGTAEKAIEADRKLLSAALVAALLEAFVMGERAEKDRWLE